MPDTAHHAMQQLLTETHSLLTDLNQWGVEELYLPPSPQSLPVCPLSVADRADDGAAPAAACRQETLAEIQTDLGDCQRCALAAGRRNLVYGAGNPHAQLVFVGEGPGREEDASGEPFVGEAGRLLERILFAMEVERQDIYLCNVVKCRAPQNRTPHSDEIAACLPFLQRQLAAIRPQVIVALGAVAAQALLAQSLPIGQLRGHWQRYQGIALMPTFHPAYLLRNPAAKREVWEDMKLVMERLQQGDRP